MSFFEIYISLGLLSNFGGPLARKINQEINIVKTPSYVDAGGNINLAVKLKTQILFEIILRMLNLALFPVLYFMMGIGYFRFQKRSQT